MKNNWKKRLLAAAGTVAILSGVVSSILAVPAAANNGPEAVADNRTLNTWVTAADSTRNVGRIWTDKSVSADAIQLRYGQAAGGEVEKSPESDFIVALSALSSTSSETTVVGTPLDIVLVLDRSGSMDESMTSYTYTAVYNSNNGISTGRSYYIKLDNGTWQEVSYSYNNGWRYGSINNRTYVTPKTGVNDTNANHVQFYNRSQGTSVKKLTALKNAANAFIDATAEANGEIADPTQQHRIAVVSFSGSNQNSSITETDLDADWTTNAAALKNAVNGLEAGGVTRAHRGLERAQSVLDNSRTDSNVKKVVIFFTDGEPNNGENFWANIAAQAVNTAQEIKASKTVDGKTVEGARIYSIGVLTNANVSQEPTGTSTTSNNVNHYLHAVSSNYPNASATSSGSGEYSSWRLTPGTRDAGGLYYKTASGAQELNDIFLNIFEEISTLPGAAITSATGDPNSGAYITFRDTLGEFMELKDVNGIVFENQGAKSVFQTKDKVSSGNVDTYVFEGTVTNVSVAHPVENYPMSNLIIEVQRSETAQQGDIVTVKIPSQLLPLRHYDIDENNTLTITDATPVRVLYSVGMKQPVRDAMASGKLETIPGLTEYAKANAENGKVNFYSNAWGGDPDKGGTTVEFIPAATNKFYFYTENTPLYTDEACQNLLTEAPVAGTTYYYEHTYYSNEQASNLEVHNAIGVTVTQSGIDNLIEYNSSEGYYYVRGGEEKISLSGAVNFRTVKPAAGANIGGEEAANVTGTAGYALYPTWSSGVSLNYLGNNGMLSYNATGSLSIAKQTVVPEHLSGDPDAEFSFQVQLSSTDANVDVDGLYAYTITREFLQAQSGGEEPVTQAETAADYPKTGVLEVQGGKVTAMYMGASIVEGALSGNTAENTRTALTLKKDEVLTIHSIRDGVVYQITETDLPGGYSLTGITRRDDQAVVTEIADPAAGVSGDINTGAVESVTFTNTYALEETLFFPEAGFPVRKDVKTLTGETIQWQQDWEFRFTIAAGRENTVVPLPEPATITLTDEMTNVQQVAQGSFGQIEFTQEGEFVYLIIEERPQAAADRLTGISYSGDAYEVTVTIRDKGDGHLEAVVLDENGQPIQDAAGNNIQYVMKKTVGEGTGASADAAAFTNIYDLKTVDWWLPANKTLVDNSGESHTLLADYFAYDAVERPDLSVPKDVEVPPVQGPVRNTVAGDIPFAPVTFGPEDVGKTYVYDIRELIPDGVTEISGVAYDNGKTKVPGITYDDTLYRAKISVFDEDANGSAATAIDVKYYLVTENAAGEEVETLYTPTNLGLPFVNTFDPEDVTLIGDTALKVNKTFTGRDWMETDTFAFQLMPAANAPFQLLNVDGSVYAWRNGLERPAGAAVVSAMDAVIGQPAADAASKTVNAASFAGITFNRAGTYVFQVTETVPADTNGITYDQTARTITVVVANGGSGALEAEVVYDNANAAAAADKQVSSAAAFTNTYKAQSVTQPNLFSAAKNFDRDSQSAGRQWIGTDEFLFRLVPDTANPGQSHVTAAQPINYTMNNRAGENLPVASLGGMTYEEAGNYTYYIYECLGSGEPGADGSGRVLIPGVTYDRHAYKVVVTVSDQDADGRHTGELVVTGIQYSKSADTLSANPNTAIKTLADLQALTYQEVPAEDLLPVAGETLAKTVVFTNTYQAEEVTIPNDANAALHGRKTLIGRAMAEGETFDFTLKAARDYGENVVFGANATSATVTGLADGGNVRFSFGDVTFKAVGEYRFNIQEIVPAEDSNGMTYDRHISQVVVTVTDNNAGKLVAAVSYPELDNSFTNLYYTPDDAKTVVNSSGENIGSQLVSAGEILTYEIQWVNTAVGQDGKPAVGTVTITDIIPEGTVFLSADNNGTLGKDAAGNDQVQWTIPAAAGSHGSVSFQVRVQDAPNGAAIVNKAFVNGAETNVVTNYVPGKTAAKGLENITVDSDIQVGDILTFTIAYQNPESSMATVRITDTLADGLVYVENSATTGENITFQPEGQTLSWSVANVPSNAEGSVSFQARVTEDALEVNELTNTAKVKVGDKPEVTTNTVEITVPDTGSLTITKTVNVAEGHNVTAPDAAFTFTVELKDTTGNALSGTYSYTTNRNQIGSIQSGRTVTLKAGENLTITGLPIGAQYTITEANVAGFKQTAPAGQDGSAVPAEGVVAAETAAAFANTFTPVTFNGNISVEKVLVDSFANIGDPAHVIAPANWEEDYQFQMTLTAYRGAPVPGNDPNWKQVGSTAVYETQLGKNGDTAKLTVNLPELTFTAPGNYFYSIAETTPAERALGVSYSKAIYYLSVTVPEDLSAPTYDLRCYIDQLGNEDTTPDAAERAVFYNEYNLNDVNWSPYVTKHLETTGGITQGDLNGNLFPFTFQGQLLNKKPDGTTDGPIPSFVQGNAADELASKQAHVLLDGRAPFRSVNFTRDHLGENDSPKTYYYRFWEINNNLPGVTYDSVDCYVTVTVSKVTINNTDAIVLEEHYYKEDPNGATTLTLPQALADGRTEVTVSEIENLQHSVEFTNVYDPENVSVTIPVQKVLDGRDWEEGETFRFQLVPVDGTILPDGAEKLTASAAETENGEFAFTYSKPGTYRYHIQEVLPETRAPGMTYDEALRHVVVTVTDKDAGGSYTGKLTAAVTFGATHENQSALEKDSNGSYQPLVFTNQYSVAQVSVEEAFPVSKSIAGRNWRSGDSFGFVLTAQDGAPMPADAVTAEGKTTKQVIISDAGQTPSFGTITYTAPGTYAYTVQEEAGTIAGIAYSTAVYKVQVVVSDLAEDGKTHTGILTAKVQVQDENGAWAEQTEENTLFPLAFTNSYAAGTGSTAIMVEKTMNGNITDWSGYTFEFKLTPKNDAPMPMDAGGNVLDTIQIQGAASKTAATGAFANITFQTAGTYEYTVSETLGTAENITYDRVPVNVVITVTDDGSGTLQTAVVYDNDADLRAASFANLYSEHQNPPKTVYNVTRSIDGRVAAPGDVLEYTIRWGNTDGGNDVKVTITDTIPAGTAYVEGSATSTVSDPGAQTAVSGGKDGAPLVWTITGVPAGATGRVTFQVKVLPEAVDNTDSLITNKGTVARNDFTVDTTETETYVPAKTKDKDVYGIGEPIHYTIAYKNTQDVPAVITITDKLDERLTYVSAGAGAVYDMQNHTVTWTIQNVQPNAAGNVTLTVVLNDKALVGEDGSVTEIPNVAVVNGYETNIVTVPLVSREDLSFTKTVVRADQSELIDANKNQAFTFSVKLLDAGSNVITDTYAYEVKNEAGETVSTGSIPNQEGRSEIVLTHGQTATIQDLPRLTQYILTETAAGGYSVADGDVLRGTLTESKQIAITNIYSAEPAKINLAAAKVVENAPDGLDTEGHFSFGVYDNAGCTGEPVAVGRNGADGSVVFSEMQFAAAGTYSYYIKEHADPEAQHIDFDDTVYQAVVTVADDGSGKLTASVKYAVVTVQEDGSGNLTTSVADIAGIPAFTNFYEDGYLIGGINLEATKKLTGRDMEAREFAFGVFDAQGNMVAGGFNDENGHISFNALTYAVMALEVEQTPAEPTIQVHHENLVPAYISVDDRAILTEEEMQLLAQGEAVHVDLLMSRLGQTITEEELALIAEVIPGETVTDALYLNLTLYKTVGEGERVSVPAMNAPVTLTFCGTVNCRLAQIVGNEMRMLTDLDGDDNDTITIQTDSLGDFVLLTFEQETPEETNPEPTEEPMPEVTEPADPTEPAPTEEPKPEVTEPMNPTEPAPTEEPKPEATEPADPTEPAPTEEPKPEAADPTDPTPTEESKSEGEEAAIPEMIEESGSGDEEEISEDQTEDESKVSVAQQPAYTMLYLSNTEQPSLTAVVIPAAQPGSGAVMAPLTASVFNITEFSEAPAFDIPATEVGEYWYTIQELDPELGGITYDETIYKVKVTVVNDNGQLICKAAYYNAAGDTELESVVFENIYQAEPAAQATISGSKILNGRALTAGEFTFVLTGEGIVEKTTNAADGSFQFQVGPFSEAKTYTYTLTEEKGSDENITYSEASFVIEVQVTDDNEGQLHAAVQYPEDTPVSFVNTYVKPDPDPIHATISGTKVLEGRELVDGEFTFVLQGTDTEATAENVGGRFSFQVGPFTTAGTHTYIITEEPGQDANVVYSDARFTVKVTVTETADGQLEAAVEYPDGAPAFVNRYEKPAAIPAEVTLQALKKMTGRKLHESEFTFLVRDQQGNLKSTGRNDTRGKIVFEPIQFSEAGTYVLTVTEHRGMQPHVIYDAGRFTVVVTVTEGADGKLTAVVDYPDSGIVFRNTYKEPPTKYTPDTTNPKTGDMQNIPMLLMICFSSAASLAVLLLPNKRKQKR